MTQEQRLAIKEGLLELAATNEQIVFKMGNFMVRRPDLFTPGLKADAEDCLTQYRANVPTLRRLAASL